MPASLAEPCLLSTKPFVLTSVLTWIAQGPAKQVHGACGAGDYNSIKRVRKGWFSPASSEGMSGWSSWTANTAECDFLLETSSWCLKMRNTLSFWTASREDDRKHRLVSLTPWKKPNWNPLEIITKSRSHGKVQHGFCQGRSKLSLKQVPEWCLQSSADAFRGACPAAGRGLTPARRGGPLGQDESQSENPPPRSPREGQPQDRACGRSIPMAPAQARSGGAGRERPPQEMAGARRYLRALTGGLRSRMTATEAAPLVYCAMTSARRCPRRPGTPARPAPAGLRPQSGRGRPQLPVLFPTQRRGGPGPQGRGGCARGLMCASLRVI